jgi:CheY-like chemotaxis protein
MTIGTRHPTRGDTPQFQLRSFQDLMRRRIRDVLLVSSQYDSFIFEEGGTLHELIHHEYSDLSQTHSPEFTRVSGGDEVLALLAGERPIDLIITTPHIEDLHPLQLVKKLRERGTAIPVVLLAFDNRELADLLAHPQASLFSGIFVWEGDFRIISAIIKQLEDRMNVGHDTGTGGVQSIILIEDSIRFYSSFLPLIYTEILKQSQRLIPEGVNPSHKFLRMRARPKILLCTKYEEAWRYFEELEEQVLGVISDVDFQREGRQDPEAGIEFARRVKRRLSDIPVLLQSNLPANEAKALEVGALFVLKDSPFLLQEVRRFIERYFGFGDFVFRMPGGEEVGRATDLKSLEEALHSVPDESLRYHGERNHFSRWLKARTEFYLAHRLRPRKVSDYTSIGELREDLISSLRAYRRMQQRGLVTDFQQQTFDPQTSFARIGGGSLGGKARGLGFLGKLLTEGDFRYRDRGVEIMIPAGVVLGTDVFDQFVEENDLRIVAMGDADDAEIAGRFLSAPRFPVEILRQLEDFLGLVREPLAVRSSSLLEDSQYQPFAGVYETYMIPNAHRDPAIRLRELLDAIKRVYASTFSRRAKDYIRVTSYRLEEEKMAVIVQKMVGGRHGGRFYPNFAGVARSYNFYPSPPQKSSDGIVSVALGLGKTVVEGGASVRFCPKFPGHLQHYSSADDALANHQHEFFALDMEAAPAGAAGAGRIPEDVSIRKYPLSVAEEDGTLVYVGSTYSAQNDAVYDGISRSGTRLVTFAPVLKNKLLPLADILNDLLAATSEGVGTAVEMEFAVNMDVPAGEPVEFGFLQLRPLVVSREFEELQTISVEPERVLCRSEEVLGNGIIDTIGDIVYVDHDLFERSHSLQVAQEVGYFNAKLLSEQRPYLLIGMGRWGTVDPWLGIPVQWDQVGGARAIIESGFKDIVVAPSQGSHFFQNLTAFMIGYFTVNPAIGQGSIDWGWLSRQQPSESRAYTKHLRLSAPLIVRMNGHEGKGMIIRPA